MTAADDSDGPPFLGTPYAFASSQPFDYPFPINCRPPSPPLSPQKPPSALLIASSLVSAPSLVQPSSDSFASLPSVVSSLVSTPPSRSYRTASTSTDRPVLRRSRSNSSSLVSARSTKFLLTLSPSQDQGSGSSSPSTHNSLSISPSKPSSLSSRNSSPNGRHQRMTLATAPSPKPCPAGETPQRPKSLSIITNQSSRSSANPGSFGSSQSSGIGSFSSRSITSIVDDKHIPPTLRSKLQRNGALVVASYDALPKSTEASAHVTPPKVHGPTPRPAPLPLLKKPKRPLPFRAYSHASSFSIAAPGPIQELEESMAARATSPSPTESARTRKSSMKRVIRQTASLVELGLEGLKRAASGRSSASSKRSRTRAGSRTQDTTEASGDSGNNWRQRM